MKWFFKLERDVELDMPTAWSGFVMGDTMLDAHTAIKAKLGVDKMPSNTLVQSQRDIIDGVQQRASIAAPRPQPSSSHDPRLSRMLV